MGVGAALLDTIRILVHVEDDGENAASRALQKNIGEAQEHFKMCLQDTRASMGLLGGAVGSGGRRRMAWDKHVNPGILGVTPGQEALAERLRRKRALRLIQRTWRAYYKRTAPVRKAKAAAAKKAKVQAKREEEATVVIQKTWRGGGGRVE
eukprot:gene16442-19519_t